MRKIGQLYINEIIKIKKKKSIIIILCIMIALVFGYGGLMKLVNGVTDSLSYSVSGYSYEDEINSIIENDEGAIVELEEDLNNAQSEEEKASIQYQIDCLNIDIEYQNMLINYEVDAYLDVSFRIRALDQIKECKENLTSAEYGYLNIDEGCKKHYENVIASMEKSVEEDDFSLYIDAKKEYIKYCVDFDEKMKKIELESLDMLESATDGEDLQMIEYQISIWQNAKNSIETGLSSEGAILSAQEMEELKDSIAVQEYKFENGYYTSDNSSSMTETTMSGMIGMGLIAICILAIILAGGSISSEMSSGSIKSLIISPTKRWKIFTAKILSLSSVTLVGILLAYIAAILGLYVFFGGSGMMPYVYASSGVAHTIPFFLYELCYMLLSSIQVFVFMIFAFMLSIITKNTAASVGLSLGIYFGGDIAFSVVRMISYGKWMDFIPFSNFGIADMVFSNSSLIDMVGSMGMGGLVEQGQSVLFSVVYLILLSICMIWIGFDSFIKKDI